MVRMITETTVSRISRKQLATVLKQATSIKSAPSTGDNMEYTLRMMDGGTVAILVTEAAAAEHVAILEAQRFLDSFAYEYRTA